MLYVLKVVNYPYYKIGVTTKTTVEDRLSTIQKMCPFKLEIFRTIESKHSRQLETTIHNHFVNKKIHGEWFHLVPDDLPQIDEVHNNFEPKIRKTFNIKSKPKTNYYNDINSIVRLLKESYIGQGKSTYKSESGYSGDTYQLVGNIFKLSSVTLRKLVRVFHYDPELLKEIDNHNHTITSADNILPKGFSVRIEDL